MVVDVDTGCPILKKADLHAVRADPAAVRHGPQDLAPSAVGFEKTFQVHWLSCLAYQLRRLRGRNPSVMNNTLLTSLKDP